MTAKAVTAEGADPKKIRGLAQRFRRGLGEAAVISEPEQLGTYARDGLSTHRSTPGLVVLPETTEAVREVVRGCVAAGVPYVARGSGTGLSGGACSRGDGVLVVTSRMRRVLEVDIPNQRAVLEPGVVNLDISRAAAPHGYYYAPDPSSQRICSIGGNVAENAGGPHCLKYGFTVHHVLGLEVVTPDGEVVWLGGRTPDTPGYDLLGAFVGSEGTLGIATKVVVRLLRAPEAVRTLLAAFPSTEAAGAAVSAVIGAGIVPAAVELMDELSIAAAEACVGCGYPTGAGAVLIVELDGPAAEVGHSFAAVERLCGAAGAFELRSATGEAERAAIWRGRHSAFAAVGRISPNYIIQDGVVPRTALPRVLRDIAAVSSRAGLRVANVFRAGDGNLHPLVLFDASRPGEAARAEEVSAAILDLCIAHGGSITGEHGVGVDKMRYMPRMFTAEDLDTMQLLRRAFDPHDLCNPGKIFPTPRPRGDTRLAGTFR